MTVKLMQGNEAIAMGAIAAGCRFYAGYPITPSTEVAEVLSRELPKVGGKFIQMEDEIASMAAIIGARVGGLKSMTATSGPGFSLMQENLGYAVKTEIPCVVVDVQRLGPSTGQPTAASQGDVMQARWGTHGDHPIIVLSPISVRQAFDLTVTAFDMSERYRTPVILLTDEIVGHMREPVELPDFSTIKIYEQQVAEKPEEYKAFRNTPDGVPSLASFGEGYRYHITGMTARRGRLPHPAAGRDRSLGGTSQYQIGETHRRYHPGRGGQPGWRQNSPAFLWLHSPHGPPRPESRPRSRSKGRYADPVDHLAVP